MLIGIFSNKYTNPWKQSSWAQHGAPPGAGRIQVGPMLAPWTLLSEIIDYRKQQCIWKVVMSRFMVSFKLIHSCCSVFNYHRRISFSNWLNISGLLHQASKTSPLQMLRLPSSCSWIEKVSHACDVIVMQSVVYMTIYDKTHSTRSLKLRNRSTTSWHALWNHYKSIAINHELIIPNRNICV